MDEVLARALVRKRAIEWDEEKAKPTETSVTTEPPVEEDSSTLTAHKARPPALNQRRCRKPPPFSFERSRAGRSLGP